MATTEKEEVKVMFDSPEAAKIGSVKGWISRDGHFYGFGPDAESIARYDGCTHKTCDFCNEDYFKNSYCKPCHKRKRSKVYESLEFKEWDGETPLVIFDDDTYFFDEDSIHDYAEEHGVKVESLWLVICQPVHLHEYEINEDHVDELPDDHLVEDGDVLDAVEALNAAIKKAGPIGWEDGSEKTTVRSRA